MILGDAENYMLTVAHSAEQIAPGHTKSSHREYRPWDQWKGRSQAVRGEIIRHETCAEQN